MDDDTLQANLYLFAADFATLKTRLAGYTEDGIYSECVEGIRESMADFPALVRSGKLPLPLIAQIFDFYYQLEGLARDPYPTNNAEAFKNGDAWRKVKLLAQAAADALDR